MTCWTNLLNQESSDKDSDCEEHEDEEVVETNIKSISEALAATESEAICRLTRLQRMSFGLCLS